MSGEEIGVPCGLTTDGLLGARYMARFIDSVILSLLVVGILWLTGIRTARNPGEAHFSFLGLALVLIVWIGYGAVLEASAWQATLGKRIMGLRVYNAEGGRLRYLQSAARSSVKDGPFILLALLPQGRILGLIWLVAHLVTMHASPVYQAIHDRAAGSWVAAPETTTQLHLT